MLKAQTLLLDLIQAYSAPSGEDFQGVGVYRSNQGLEQPKKVVLAWEQLPRSGQRIETAVVLTGRNTPDATEQLGLGLH